MDAYKIGQRAADQGIEDMRGLIDAYWHETQHYTHTEMVCAEAGLIGEEKPYIVTGWRFGNIPSSGLSYNYRDDRPEAGVSVMAVDGGAETQDKLSALFISIDRPRVRVRGLLHTFRTGADGEPLLLDAIEIV